MPLQHSGHKLRCGDIFVLPVYMPDFKRLDYGPSVFDHRNNISLSYVWDFPKYKGGPLVLREVINGCRLQVSRVFIAAMPWMSLSVRMFRSQALGQPSTCRIELAMDTEVMHVPMVSRPRRPA